MAVEESFDGIFLSALTQPPVDIYFFLEVREGTFEVIDGGRDIGVGNVFVSEELRQVILDGSEGGAQALMFELFLPIAFV